MGISVPLQSTCKFTSYKIHTPISCYIVCKRKQQKVLKPLNHKAHQRPHTVQLY